jgi:hypothetical protein
MEDMSVFQVNSRMAKLIAKHDRTLLEPEGESKESPVGKLQQVEEDKKRQDQESKQQAASGQQRQQPGDRKQRLKQEKQQARQKRLLQLREQKEQHKQEVSAVAPAPNEQLSDGLALSKHLKWSLQALTDKHMQHLAR